MIVYVLTQIDRDTKTERPCAVCTSEQQAEQFYALDNKNHDYIPFNVDEIPQLSGVPYETPAPNLQEEAIRNTTNSLRESTRLMQETLKNLKNRRK